MEIMMDAIVEKLRKMELEVSKEKGDFRLYALFLRQNMPNKWDFLISAPWADKQGKQITLKYMFSKIHKYLTIPERHRISRIVIIDKENPDLPELLESVKVKHDKFETINKDYFGIDINHAYFITTGSTESHE